MNPLTFEQLVALGGTVSDNASGTADLMEDVPELWRAQVQSMLDADA